MTPQTPAEGILKTGEWGTSKTYHITCDCTNPDCAHDIDIEADDYGTVTVTLYTEQKTPWWERALEDNHKIDNEVLAKLDRTWKDLVNGIIRRVKLTWNIWVHGYVKYEGSIVLKEQVALNYGATLLAAAEDVKALNEERTSKKDTK